MLVLSRKLTPTAHGTAPLRLDSTGEPSGALLPELGDFLAALPGLSTGPFDDGRARSGATLAEDLRTVRWQLPDGFDAVEFLPIGLGDSPVVPRLAAAPNRLLVVSPFDERGNLYATDTVDGAVWRARAAARRTCPARRQRR